MKKSTASLIILIAGLFVFGQTQAQDAPNKKDEKGKKQGHWIKLDDNKKKIYDGNFIDDVPVGKFVYYFDNGEPWSISVFSNNGTVTHTKIFDAGGKLSGEGKYVNQKKDSLWKYYNHEGNLISEENYLNGLKSGVEKVFYPTGGIVEEKYWKNGQLNGTCKKYFETGQIRYEGQYINGKVDGYVKFYHSNGKIYVEGLYVNDLKHGKWKYYKKDGTPERTEEYINGRLQGEDLNVIPKEQVEKEKQNAKQFEAGDAYDEGYSPTH